MVDTDEEADDVIVKQQRSFRRVQFVGIGMLFIVMAMSAALAMYFYIVFGSLKEAANRLERNAFDSRIASDRQTNQVATLERSMRRTFDEFRRTTASGSDALEAKDAVDADGMTAIDAAPAIEASTQYLRRGISSLQAELVMRSFADMPGVQLEVVALLDGTLSLLDWERSGEEITVETVGLPARLAEADRLFDLAANDPALKPLAKTGSAWIDFIFADSDQSNYAPTDCQALHRTISEAAPEAGPQTYFWAASCNRKLGDRLKALDGYAHVLSDVASAGEDGAVVVPLPASRDDSELLLELNGFHGLGTQLISTVGVQPSEIAFALRLAATRCSPASPIQLDIANVDLATRMNLARKCLERAIDVRRQLGQTPNERSGSKENISFAYLRERDFKGAFDNAQQVTSTGYFGWNELVRALAASQLGSDDPDLRAAGLDARRNVSYFRVAELNPCELKVLLDEELFAVADEIVKQEHGGEGLACESASAKAGG